MHPLGLLALSLNDANQSTASGAMLVLMTRLYLLLSLVPNHEPASLTAQSRRNAPFVSSSGGKHLLGVPGCGYPTSGNDNGSVAQFGENTSASRKPGFSPAVGGAQNGKRPTSFERIPYSPVMFIQPPCFFTTSLPECLA